MSTRDRENRQKQFKNIGRHDEMRRRRAEGSVELRKQKKDEQLMKRRNVDATEEVQIEDSENNSCPEDPALTDKKAAKPILSLEECCRVLGSASGDSDEFFLAIESLRRKLSKNQDPPVDEIIKAGLLIPLVAALDHPNPKLQFEACWALTNIVSGTPQQTQAAIEKGVIPPLVKLLSSEHMYVAEQAAWALGNITGDNAVLRDLVIAAGAVAPLMQLIRKDNLSLEFLRTLAWIFSNFCRHKQPRIPTKTLEVFLPILAQMIHHTDQSVVQDSLWALSYATDGTEDDIQCALNCNILPRLSALLKTRERVFMPPIIRTLGNIVTGTDLQTQMVVSSGVLTEEILPLLEESSTTISKECCWMLSNILAGTRQQIDAVINAGLLPHLVRLAERGDHKTRVEAMWCLSNLVIGGDIPHVGALVQLGGLQALVAYMDAKDPKLLKLILNTLAGIFERSADVDQLEKVTLIFEECGGLDKLEALQEHENESIYKGALALIEQYFNADDEELGVTDKENSNPGECKEISVNDAVDMKYQF